MAEGEANDLGAWDGLRAPQGRELTGLTPRQRLEWLEDAIDFAYRVGALARRRADAQARADATGIGAG